MDLYEKTANQIAYELGNRIRVLRLRRNITQQELAERTRRSLNTIKALESGRGKLSTLIPVLRELRSLEELNHFIPEISISPIQLAKRRGKKRERASGKRIKK